MPNYRRLHEGNAYFFTVVTYNRLPIFNNDLSIQILQASWKIVEERFPFTTIANCIMPDHIHTIWILPENDQNYSVRWKEIKYQFTKRYLAEIGPGETRNLSRQNEVKQLSGRDGFGNTTLWTTMTLPGTSITSILTR